MNKRQLIILWVGIAVFILFGLTTDTRFFETDLYIGAADATKTHLTDYGPLTVRLTSTIFVTVALIYTLKDNKRRRGPELWLKIVCFFSYLSWLGKPTYGERLEDARNKKRRMQGGAPLEEPTAPN
ncbi:MAG: hypothetical protein ACYS74_15350 [Planctomycetota bacterium]